MTPKVRNKNHGIIDVLKSSEGFQQLTGGPNFPARAMKSMKGAKLYQPDQGSSSFGDRPRFKLSKDFDTVKLDTDSYSDILRGASHRRGQVAKHKKSAHAPTQYLARVHHAKAPKVDAKTLAKYSPKKKQHAQALAKNSKAHRPKLAVPTLALFYTSGPGSLSLRPEFGFRFNNAKEAYGALKKGEINARSLVQFVSAKRQEVFSQASSLAFYMQSAKG